MYKIVKPVFDEDVRYLCRRPYPGHLKGCPNWGQRPTCPPEVSLFYNLFDISREFYVIWTIFPFGDHVKKMKSLHPAWSARQLSCCLYWQGTARKLLRREILFFNIAHPNMAVTTIPEAMGINVTQTMLDVGEQLEWPPKTKTYQVAIAGFSFASLMKGNI